MAPGAVAVKPVAPPWQITVPPAAETVGAGNGYTATEVADEVAVHPVDATT